MSVVEVPSDATVSSFLATRGKSQSASSDSPMCPPVTRVLLNSELLESVPGRAVDHGRPLLGSMAGQWFSRGDAADGLMFATEGMGDVAWRVKGLAASSAPVAREQATHVTHSSSETFNRKLQWGDLIQIVEEQYEVEGGHLPAVVSYADWLDEGDKALKEQEVRESGDCVTADPVAIEFHRQRLAASWKSGDAKEKQMVGV